MKSPLIELVPRVCGILHQRDGAARPWRRVGV